MITSTFCHLPRIGEAREKSIWAQGVTDWSRFMDSSKVRGISHQKKPYYDRHLKRSMRALMDGNSSFFNSIPSGERWRLWKEYREEACLLDIETNYRNDITVLGISDGNETWQFVKGHNMDLTKIQKMLSRFKLIVTFNGSSFDIPIIRRRMGAVIPGVPHIDLRHAAAKAGLHGGLKQIEKTLGISRPEAVEEVNGIQALQLWEAYRGTGKRAFLDLLLEYNAEDTLNLQPLADAVYERISSHNMKILKKNAI